MLTIIVTLIVLNIVLYAGRVFADSGAAGVSAPSADAERSGDAPRVSAPENCPDAKRAVRYYQRRYAEWRAKMGAGQEAGKDGNAAPDRGRVRVPCPRYLAQRWKRRAYLARIAYKRWREYHFAWWKWLPYDWQARSRCELGYPLQPRSWRSNVYTSNGNFQGFVNFHSGTWDDYRLPGYPSEAYLATPRQQYVVALAVARSAGLGAWQSCATP